MARQWIRDCSLIAQGSGGKIQLNQMRIRFIVRQKTTQSPNTLVARVYNLSDATADKFVKMEFKEIELQAGYEGNIGRIFIGQIKQTFKGRESPTDTYLDIYAADGDLAYNFGTVNKTLKAGHTFKDQLNVLADAMKPFGIKLGHVPEGLDQIKMPRAASFFGMARDGLRELAQAVGCTCAITDGTLDLVPVNGSKPGDVIVLNARTGMISMPVQTQGGIIVKALINPKFRPFTTIKLDNSSIQRAGYNMSYGGEPMNSEPYMPSLSSDGLYNVLFVNWEGDTRGGPWYAELSCHAKGGTPTKAQTDTFAG